MTDSEFSGAWREFPRQWLIGLKIPQRTVDDYRAGKAPPEWMRPRILAALKAEQSAAQNRPPATSRSGKQARKRQGGA